MRYTVSSIEGNRQRLDGGAMFGNVPRALWERWSAPDARHRIELACRAFLVHDHVHDRRILLEAGIGVFFAPKLRDRFGVDQPQHVLLESLAARGVEPAAIDIVVLSHLHFDHAGGLLSPWREEGGYELVFPNARFIVGRDHWRRAQSPHPRDRASFLPELHALLEQSGRLELVDGTSSPTLGADFSFTYSEGHTPGLMLTELRTDTGSAVFCGDLIPGVPWVHLPITMGYDRFPERLIDEKSQLLATCLAHDTRLLFTHDAGCAACFVERDESGRFSARDPLPRLDETPI